MGVPQSDGSRTERDRRTCGCREERGLGDLALGKKNDLGSRATPDEQDTVGVLIWGLRMGVRNQVSLVRAAAWCPMYRAGRAGMCPGPCPPWEALSVGPGLSLSPVSSAVLSLTAVLTLPVSVARGSVFFPLVCVCSVYCLTLVSPVLFLWKEGEKSAHMFLADNPGLFP